VLSLLVCLEECNAVHIAIVLYLSVNLISEECLDCIVKLELPHMSTDITHDVMRPISMLNSMEEAVVFADPESILQSFEVHCGI